MNKHQIWCVIPVYNNGETIKAVADGCREYIEHVLIVDDGSTDIDIESLFTNSDITVISHAHNIGKGEALKTGLNYLREHDATHMITIDADAQHIPKDILRFIAEIEIHPTDIIIGCRDFTKDNIPASSKFGRRFSNLWLRIETGRTCSDTQSGFRAYPVSLISQLKLHGNKYDFEVEILARAIWAGLNLHEIDIDVHYSPPEERISHFDKLWDNVRISLMHTRLVARLLLPLPHKRLVPRTNEKLNISLLKHPIKLLKTLLQNEDASPMGLAAAAGIGTFLAVLPLIACHTIVIIYVATRLHLNKIMAIAIQNLYAPPLVPFLCIWLGYFIRNGESLTNFDLTAFSEVWKLFLFDWLIGSLILAPILAITATIIVYIICIKINNKQETGL